MTRRVTKHAPVHSARTHQNEVIITIWAEKRAAAARFSLPANPTNAAAALERCEKMLAEMQTDEKRIREKTLLPFMPMNCLCFVMTT